MGVKVDFSSVSSRPKRQGISLRMRFWIFKRDHFRCTYCGAGPMETVLQIDHRVAIADGGSNDVSNLVTACFECNAGKAAETLN